MIVQMKELFELTGESREIACEVTLEELEGISNYHFATPVEVKGTVSNRAGIVTLSYETRFKLDNTCDRCLKEFIQEYAYSFKHTLVRSCNTDNDEYVVCGNNTLDMNELAVSDILLTLPTKILCKEDCKGLCCVCGADLNESDCEHNA
ncbi:MAG: DUF177 domain-containing protein [Ruminococcus sp.]|nr:DUF177 domain-containing protein [Ruminococcus sp.]